MILPPGGFLTLGLLLLFFSWLEERKRQLANRLADTELASQ
jgi:electron transport complex protein RnfE